MLKVDEPGLMITFTVTLRLTFKSQALPLFIGKSMRQWWKEVERAAEEGEKRLWSWTGLVDVLEQSTEKVKE